MGSLAMSIADAEESPERHSSETDPVMNVYAETPTVLVVDDEKGPRLALQMLLSENYRVITANDVPSARSMLGKEPIDLVISDIRMPGETGVDLLRHVHEKHPEVEVMLLTGFGELSTAKEAVRLGAYAYLEKPFDNSALMEHVDGAMKRRQTERERRRMERLSLEANRFELLGRIVSGLIHDMGSPLSVAGTQLEMLLTGSGSKEMRDRLEMVLGQVSHCSDLVRAVLAFLRNSEGDAGDLDLHELSESCLELAAPLLRNQRVEVQRAYANAVAPFRGDFVLVRQAVLNLMNNACQAMEDQEDPQRITVSTWSEGNRVCLAVADSGTGIPAEKRELVFDTFFTTKGKKGNGLGLAAVRNIMRRHNGEAFVSEGPDGGAQFVLCFPAAPRS